MAIKTSKKKKIKKVVSEGRVCISVSFNNTLVTVTDMSGNVISWSSAGANGFKGARKSTPYAAQVTSENAIEKSKAYSLERAHVTIQGVGSGREQSIRGIQSAGIEILSITDVTPIPHNGCRAKKKRRV
jgi:small subunit ribosomal protein S11